MSNRYSSATRFTFEPVAEGVALDTTAVAYTTPQPLRERLNNLILVTALRANARFYMTHNATSGTAVARLTDGTNNAVEVTMSLASSPVSFNQPADLSRFVGSSALYWEVEVTSAAGASTVGRVIADLTAETPIFVSAGQC